MVKLVMIDYPAYGAVGVECWRMWFLLISHERVIRGIIEPLCRRSAPRQYWQPAVQPAVPLLVRSVS
jgi:hypothetical protein